RERRAPLAACRGSEIDTGQCRRRHSRYDGFERTKGPATGLREEDPTRAQAAGGKAPHRAAPAAWKDHGSAEPKTPARTVGADIAADLSGGHGQEAAARPKSREYPRPSGVCD